MKNAIILIAISILFTTTAAAQDANAFISKADAFFSTVVKNGKVNYKAIAAHPAQINSLAAQIGDANLASGKSSINKAFYINAYNVLVIKQIIDNKGVTSPLDVAGFFDKNKFKVAGDALTLNNIENKKLRAVYKDARLHFVLVCGALGCPPLIATAYKPETLDQQLTEQTTLAINNPAFIKESKRIGVSQIFEWYNEDFVTKNSSLVDYLNKYRKQPLPENTKTKYYTYNWKLNKQ